MSEMVERVARAMCVADGREADAGPEVGLRPNWMHFIGLARAAIEAMKQPTEAMTKAGQGVMQDFYDSFCVVTPGEANEVWQAMITAALDDGTGPIPIYSGKPKE